MIHVPGSRIYFVFFCSHFWSLDHSVICTSQSPPVGGGSHFLANVKVAVSILKVYLAFKSVA